MALIPISIMVPETIGTLGNKHIFKVLFDTGSTKTMIHRSCLSRGTIPTLLGKKASINTMAGTLTAA